MNKAFFYLIFLFLNAHQFVNAQDYFKLNGKVESRNWNLTSKAMKSAEFIEKASVELQNSAGIISKSETDAGGNFELNIPSSGEFTLVVSYAGLNQKKFILQTKAGSTNIRPTINMIGVITTKHTKGMSYLGLAESRVTYTGNKAIFVQSNVHDGELKLIQKFCTANKLGDIALEKKNYQLAKIFYQMAMDMMDGETYPKDQIKKVEEAMKTEKGSRKKQTIKHNKLKSAITNQKTGSGSNKNSSYKTSTETGKATRKTRMTLGKNK